MSLNNISGKTIFNIIILLLMTSAETVLKSENIYFGQATIAGIPCTAGYIKKFKWSWLATQLNTFITIGETDNLITKEVLEDFSSHCYKYALKNHKGRPRGLQAGVGSIAILAGNNITEEAIKWCEKTSKKHWSAFEIPVLYRPSEKLAVRYLKQPVWGRLYFPYFTETIDMITSRLSW